MPPATRTEVANRLRLMRHAYAQLANGAHALLEEAPLYWTERLLLRLVRHLYRRRLEEVGGALTAVSEEDDERAQLKANMLEAQVEAALQGHDLSRWEEVEDGRGYQATCSKCGMSVYVSGRTMYSVLAEACGGGERDDT